MRLTLVISSLERGGAERILSVLAGAWVQRGIQVTLVTFDDRELPAYPLHPGITLRSLRVPNETARNPFYAVYPNLRRIGRLRRHIHQSRPDIVISFLDFPNVITLLATRGLGLPVIVSERANPEYVYLNPVWKRLRRLLYPRASALVCQTSAMVSQLHETIKTPGYAIPNPVELPATLASASPKGEDTNTRTIIAMGRLVPQKGFDLLLQAFAGIAARHPAWSIKVLGQGPLKDQLEAQAESLGLKTRVNFVGAISDPFVRLFVSI
jgi:GalNAc-alpha-(1->4)-GalNAc-alpha-(1->3)-diNAcBac-PP-undecaprenol alpha-1,4-N-acetyl-D-galactosaminyltransferase